MARTRWPPGPVNPGLCTGQADQTGSAGGCQSRGPADRSLSRQPEKASADSEVRPDPGPTLRPHHRKTTQAGPKHYPHPSCRLFVADARTDPVGDRVQIIQLGELLVRGNPGATQRRLARVVLVAGAGRLPSLAWVPATSPH